MNPPRCFLFQMEIVVIQMKSTSYQKRWSKQFKAVHRKRERNQVITCHYICSQNHFFSSQLHGYLGFSAVLPVTHNRNCSFNLRIPIPIKLSSKVDFNILKAIHNIFQLLYMIFLPDILQQAIPQHPKSYPQHLSSVNCPSCPSNIS